ncbi:MAG: FecR domain-containing protein, partial [Pseudomonadota bacterium]
MGYRGENDFSNNQDVEIIQLNGDEAQINLPDSAYVRDAELTRDGMDLNLETDNGTITVEGYFALESAPDLVAPDGSTLTSDLVDSFATSSPEYAQNLSMMDISPVGAVDEFTGDATVTRADGSTEQVSMGTKIYEGDIIETGTDGAVNIMFVDETTFAVSEDARMAIDEYVFDASTQGGVQNFSVLKGVFVFTSGLIGREDPDDVMIETPVGSIGIRGTIIAGDVDNGEITVVEGAIVLRDFNGNEVTLANQFETAQFDQAGGQINNMGELSANDVGAKFQSVSNVSPQLFSSIQDAAAEEGNADGSVDAVVEGVNQQQGPEGENNAQQDQKQDQPTDQPGENQDNQFKNDADGAVDENNDNKVDGTVEDGTAPDAAQGDAAPAEAAEPTAVEGQGPAADQPVQDGPRPALKNLTGQNQLLDGDGGIDLSGVNNLNQPAGGPLGGLNRAPPPRGDGPNTAQDGTNSGNTAADQQLPSSQPFTLSPSINLSGNQFIVSSNRRGFVTEDSVVRFNLSDTFVAPNGGDLNFEVVSIKDSAGNPLSWNDTQINISSGKLIVNVNNLTLTQTDNYSIEVVARDNDASTAPVKTTFQLEIVDADIVGTNTNDPTGLDPANNGDIVLGLDGNDNITFAGALNDVKVFGDAGDDFITAQGNNNLVSGGKGDDIIDVTSGEDSLYLGGQDDDTFNVYDPGNNEFDGGSGFDSLEYTSSNDITFTYKFDHFEATDGTNIDILRGIEHMAGGAANHTADFSGYNGGVEIMYEDNAGNLLTEVNVGDQTYQFFRVRTYEGGQGDDIFDLTGLTDGSGVTFYGNDGNDIIKVADGFNTLNGGAGDDTIFGGVGNDIIEDGLGRDNIYGGAGNDLFQVKDTKNFIRGEQGNDSFFFNVDDHGGDVNTLLNRLKNDADNGHSVDGGGPANGKPLDLVDYGDTARIVGPSSGGLIDFAAIDGAADHFKNIETLDIGNTHGNTLRLKLSDIIEMTDGDNSLIIKTDGGGMDSVEIIDDLVLYTYAGSAGAGQVGGAGSYYDAHTYSTIGTDITVYIQDTGVAVTQA